MEKIKSTKKMLLDHVLYEIHMYLFTIITKPSDQFSVNLILESQLIHLRNLLYFFVEDCKRAYKTDIIYSDIIESEDSLAIDSAVSYKARSVINKAVSHLAMERISGDFTEEVKVQKEKLKPIVIGKIKAFMEQLPTNIKPEHLYQLEDIKIKNLMHEIIQIVKSYE